MGNIILHMTLRVNYRPFCSNQKARLVESKSYCIHVISLEKPISPPVMPARLLC
nr:hypothetical protein Q903MT_gene6024 [Picea sitchensis]